MTTYISSLIEPVFRHARRLSRTGSDAERPTHLVQPPEDTTRDAIEEEELADTAVGTGGVSRRIMAQNAALDRVLADDVAGDEEAADALSPMSISTPAEEDLRLLDQQRMQRMREGPFGHAVEEASTSNIEGNRSRGRTDPLPRRPVQGAANRRHISWQSDGPRPRRPVPSSSLSESSNTQFFDDPVNSRSVPMSTGGMTSRSSAMSLDSGTPASPADRHAALALPEDDGMRAMRDRIKAIQSMDIDPDEKSRLLHSVMTEKWATGQALLHDGSFRPQSPATASLRSQDAPTTPRTEASVMAGTPSRSDKHLMSPSTSLDTEPADDELVTTAEDLEPTYWKPQAQTPAPPDQAGEAAFSYGDEDLFEDQEEEEQQPLGCEHYKRNVKLQCADCHRWYTCRFCHDAAETHTLVRHRTRNMLCMVCGTAQPAGKTCTKCHETAAAYYCSVCKLWDDDASKKIYHCSACGICRRGEGLGKDFFHCPTCDVCISMSMRDTHRCIERSVDCDCPICGEYMFNSPTTVVFMRCGHGIHHVCYKRYLERSYRCPICAKSLLNMEMTFHNLDIAIEAQPMPEEFRGTRAIVHCNDCRCKTSVPYHWLGLKCDECGSYNTAQVSIVGPDGTGGTVPDGAGTALNSTDAAGNEQASAAASRHGSIADGSRSRAASGNLLVDTNSRSRRPLSTGGIHDVRPSPSGAEFYPIVSNSRSVSAMGIDRTRPGWEGSAAAAAATAGTNVVGNSNNNEDEDEDLDFWGGDLSPRLRSLISTTDVPSVEDEEEGLRAEQGEDDEESDSSDDEEMGEALDDEADEEDEIDDGMELFGHR